MPERVRIVEKNNGLRKSTVQTELSNQNLGTGLSEGRVERIRVTVLGKNDRFRTIGMAEKIFDISEMPPEKKQELISQIVETHQGLKERHLPTLPTMRREREGDSIIMTDLTQGGKNEVVSVPDWAIGEKRKGKYSDTEYKVELRNVEEIEEDLASILEQTVITGCLMHLPDVFFLVVNKEEKKGEIILGDIAEIEFVDEINTAKRIQLIEQNYQTILSFVREMRHHIESEQTLSVMRSIIKKMQELKAQYSK